jgi:hypothetical protein
MLYDEIHGNAGFFGTDGAGVSGAHGAQDGWAGLASLMARAYWRTEAALAKAGAEWEGGAADAMRSGVTPLSQWAVDAHDASTASAESTETHVLSYSAAKHNMPEPVKVTSTANSDGLGIPAMYTHLLGGQTDQDKQEAAAQEAKAEAVRIMGGYEAESGFARASVGQFVPPASVTVAVAPPQPKGGDGIPVGGGEPPQTGRERSDGTAFPRDTSGGTGGPGGTPPPSVGSSAPPGTNTSSAPAATTTPSFITTPPSTNPVTTGLVPDPPRGTSGAVPPGGFSTVGGPGERGAGGSTGRGPVGGGGAGRGPGAGGGLRGGLPGTAGGPVNEPVAGRAAGSVGASGARGAAGMGGMGPAGGRSDGDEDKEHKTAEYLRDYHDGFWDDTPPVAPAVIGEDED